MLKRRGPTYRQASNDNQNSNIGIHYKYRVAINCFLYKLLTDYDGREYEKRLARPLKTECFLH